MALITDYASLQANVATFLVRGDQTANIPTFIQLAETRLNAEVRLRRAEQDRALTGVAGSRFVALPSDYDEALEVWIIPPGGSVRQDLNFIDPARLNASTDAGQPYWWTIDGANLAFERPCDQAYAFYLRGLFRFALSNTATTNALLSDYPDAYLYSVLAICGPYLRDADLTGAYESAAQAAIARANAKDARSRAQQKLVTEPGELTRYSRRNGYSIRTDT